MKRNFHQPVAASGERTQRCQTEPIPRGRFLLLPKKKEKEKEKLRNWGIIPIESDFCCRVSVGYGGQDQTLCVADASGPVIPAGWGNWRL